MRASIKAAIITPAATPDSIQIVAHASPRLSRYIQHKEVHISAMPKIVDVEQMQLRIAKAAGKAIAAKGIAEVTMIDIANAAGVSTGMITHYFEGKTSIIAAALRVPFLNMERKIAQLLEKGETELARLLDVSIPTSRLHSDDNIIWVNFWGMIATDPEFRRLNATLHGEGRKIYARMIRAAWPESRGWSGKVFETALRSIITFVFGLNAGGVTNRAVWTASVQRSQLELHLHLVRQWARQQALTNEEAAPRLNRNPRKSEAKPASADDAFVGIECNNKSN